MTGVIHNSETAGVAENPKVVAARAFEVSVVIPCLNEAKSIAICIDKARASFSTARVRGEVVVADNGSTDGSIEIAEQHGARVVRVPTKGYGNALRAGIEAAQGDFIVMGDGDDSYDFAKVPEFVAKWRDGADFVMGNRFAGGIKPGAMPWHHRYLGTPVMSSILNLFFRAGIRDVNCGMRGFTRDLYHRLGLRTTGMEFASEFVIKAAKMGTRIVEIPVTLWPDKRGRPPHLRSFRDGWRHLRFLLLMCPLWLYLVPSALLLGGGLALMAWLTPGPRAIGGITLDIHSMLVGALCVLVGYQTLWLWAFAKIHGWTSGLLPPGTFSTGLFKHVNLERGLALGAALLAGGLALNAWLFSHWLGRDLGPLEVATTLRTALWGFLLMVIGVQTIYGSFFLSMLGMRSTVEDNSDNV
jgi:hypothetical protein